MIRVRVATGVGGTFDIAAALYQPARPEYPPALYDRLLEVRERGAKTTGRR
jgi:hypothetical protein